MGTSKYAGVGALCAALARSSLAAAQPEEPPPPPPPEEPVTVEEPEPSPEVLALTRRLAEGLFRWRRLRSHFDDVVDGEPVQEWTRSGYGYVVQTGVMVHDHVELTARWEQLFDWGNTDPELVKLVDTKGKQLGGGINAYINGHALKIQGDYFYNFGEKIDDGRHIVVLAVDASF